MTGWQRLWMALVLGTILCLGGSCNIIGPCNPPQINCIAGVSTNAPQSAPQRSVSPSPEPPVTFSGMVTIGVPAASAPAVALPTPTPTPSPSAAVSPSPTPTPEPTTQASPSTSPSPTASPSPAPLRATAVVFTKEGGEETLRVLLDDTGKFNASLAAGNYRVGMVLVASDGTERTIQDTSSLLSIATGETFTLKITLTLDAGQEKLTVEKTAQSP